MWCCRGGLPDVDTASSKAGVPGAGATASAQQEQQLVKSTNNPLLDAAAKPVAALIPAEAQQVASPEKPPAPEKVGAVAVPVSKQQPSPTAVLLNGKVHDHSLSTASAGVMATGSSLASAQQSAGIHSGSAIPPWVASRNSQTPSDQYLGAGNAGINGGADGITSVNDILRLNLGEVKLVLQKLAGVNSTPTIALNEAAELLCKHLTVSFCSITGFTDHCTSYVLLAAYGNGASDIEKMPVMRGTQWSCAKLLEQPACLHYRIASAEQAARLPLDFQALYSNGHLRSFLSIPIATDHEVLGALTIAKEDAEGFEVDWWEPMLGCLSMGLLGFMRNEQTQQLCQLMKALDSSPDYVLLVHHLLRGAFNLLLRATNIRTGCRLALLNQDLTKALIFEPDRKQMTSSEVDRSALGAAGGPAGAPGAALQPHDAQIHVAEIQLENTLLLDAVQKGKARFVSDCASYIQSCMKPATDIFISGQEMVASIVVLPLIYEGHTFGGFYVTLETTSNFQNIKDLLMGFVNSVVLVLQRRIQAQRDQIWDTILKKPGTGSNENSAGEDVGKLPGSQADELARSGLDSAATSVVETTMGAKPVVVKRSCTEAMLKVLQHEIRKTHAKSQQHEWIEELTLTEIVGKGGFGVVYKGTWKGSVAAVKVMYARQHERQAMKDALEMAVLTTVSHPNIIQVYNCFTDMVEDASGTNVPMVEGRINVRFRRLQPDEDRSLATCNILVMEYCDRASLRHAMKKGVFHKRLGNTSVAVDLCAIVQVLIEVSQAIQHLHAMKLIHCDIKPENVLLKSDPSKPIGFVTKLSDFGLAKLLRENYYIVNRSGSGTVTHLAPELFQVGSKLTTAVDTFSFGIMMWELYTGQRAYGGLGRDAIIDRVYKKKARPIFPLGVPPAYAALAKAAWDNDPSARPPFTVILTKLGEMLTAFQSANSSGPGLGAAAASPGSNPGSAPSGGGGGAALPPTATGGMQSGLPGAPAMTASTTAAPSATAAQQQQAMAAAGAAAPQ